MTAMGGGGGTTPTAASSVSTALASVPAVAISIPSAAASVPATPYVPTIATAPLSTMTGATKAMATCPVGYMIDPNYKF